ncbi:MAG: CBS domain-containing protein [Firmicutes bacterium]|uniref:CBS domain-containing protein n=1 Tax=Candidatus Onthovivens merdipullorum TaxID=2840889 RepID=A0A9D9DJ06_9BACL|nr:CBS domain-containing protein [Candidatus Onthovivens merdipullorum]
MNVLYFLTPKKLIKYCLDSMSIRQALETIEYHRYQVIPILSKDGKYIGSISEGDLLYYLKNHPFEDISEFDDISIMEVSRHKDYLPIPSNTEMSSLIALAINQNFVPVLDDQKNFIGIITRKSIINYLYFNSEKE